MNRGGNQGAGRRGTGWLFGIFGLACMVSLNGCSLAAPEAGTEGGNDRLIGAFITAEYLDLYDMEGYVEDHRNLLVDGGEVTLPHDSKYAGRIYAQITKTNKTGVEDWDVSFGDVEGEYMLYPQRADEEETYRMCLSTEGICDIRTDTALIDDGEEYGISGTLYMIPSRMGEEVNYHANPVYQTPEGEIYAVSGQGFTTNGDAAEGEVFATTLSGETVMTENGKSKTEKSSVTVQFAVMNRPVQTTLYQMDQSHQILRQDVYGPGEVPEILTAEQGTAYILAETEKESLSGNTKVSREVAGYDPDEETYLETFYALDNGTVAKAETEVVWDR